ncbi:MAG: BMP family ABC transporter substrate-binding protein [Deinococcota bacterium]
MQKFVKAFTLAALVLMGTGMAQDFVMGINFDAGGKFDRSFNEGTWRGMVRAIEELESSYDIELLEFEGTPDTSAQGLRNMAGEGSELIVAPGFAQADAITSVSSEFSDTSFVIIDAVVDAPNVRSVVFKEHEGSYVVGYLAGTLSQTGVVGFVGGMDIPLIRKFNLGYEEGVMAACPDCTVISNYTGVTPAAWNDPARAKELATLQHGQGADIIYAAAGASGNGVIDWANETMCYSADSMPDSVSMRMSPMGAIAADIAKSEAYATACDEGSQPVFFIGVDSNQNFLGDTDNDPSTLNHGLTSMLKRVDVASSNAVNDVVNGEFEGGIAVLGLGEDGVGYALDEFNEALVPEELQLELELITDAIISGETVVTDFTQQ